MGVTDDVIIQEVAGVQNVRPQFFVLLGTLNQNLKRNLGHIEMHTGPAAGL